MRENTSLFFAPGAANPGETAVEVGVEPGPELGALVVTAGTSPSVPALALLSWAAANSLALALRRVSLAVRRCACNFPTIRALNPLAPPEDALPVPVSSSSSESSKKELGCESCW